MKASIWKSRVNSFLGILFVGSSALGASIIIWHAAFGENPLANVMAGYMVEQSLVP